MNESDYYSENDSDTSSQRDFEYLRDVPKYNLDQFLSDTSEEDWSTKRKENLHPVTFKDHNLDFWFDEAAKQTALYYKQLD